MSQCRKKLIHVNVCINWMQSENHRQYTCNVCGNILQQQAVRSAGCSASTVNVYIAQTDKISHCIEHCSSVN